MRKALVATLLMAGALASFAQAGSAYFSLMPGYQFSSGESDSGFVGSADGGYYFTDNVGLHLGLIYNEGKFRTDVPFFGRYSFTNRFEIFEVGPEFVAKVGPTGQFYGQINVGHTFGADTGQLVVIYVPPFYTSYRTGLSNEWTYGGALGYRYFFNPATAFSFQAAYHRINNWDTDHWDARIGVTWKF